jgi:hypothetical protein
MRYFIIIILFCAWIPASESGCKKDKDTLIWSENLKLKWTDFKNDSFPGVNVSALSAIRIRLDYEVRYNLDWVKVQCEFSKKLSIARKDKSPNLLQHEQGHFDLAEVYAREIRHEILAIRSRLNRGNYKMLDSIHHFWDSKLAKEHIKYDKETDYSRDTVMQSKWMLEIKKRLQKLSAYKQNYYKF